MALKAEAFLAAARAHIEPLRGRFIHEAIERDYLAKTGQGDTSYEDWLRAIVPWLGARAGAGATPRILDLGCGTGELAVLMNHLGFDARGIDVHDEHLALARILATENGVAADRFIHYDGGALPFPDGSFDVVTLFVVLEHLDDTMLDAVLPEVRRVCRGVVFIQVPNRLQTRDDHTGLPFLPWLPRAVALRVVRAAGPRHAYSISKDGSYDVYYRTWGTIRRRFEQHGFQLEFVPEELVFPSLAEVPPLFSPPPPGARLVTRLAYAPLRMLRDALITLGVPRRAFDPYLNFVAIPSRSVRSSGTSLHHG